MDGEKHTDALIPETETIGDDLLIGAKAIAAELNWTTRRVYHVAELNAHDKEGADQRPPIFKEKALNRVWASRSALRAYFLGRRS